MYILYVKILIYTTYRTGSHMLGEFLSKETGHNFFDEGMMTDYKNNNDFIIKMVPDCEPSFKENNQEFKFFINDDHIFFDKVIILYQEDTLNQTISELVAQQRNIWRHDGESFDAYYTIDEEFIRKNLDQIVWRNENNINGRNFLKSVEHGLKISYEDLFFGDGEDKLSDYLGIKFKTTIKDPRYKLNKSNINITETINNFLS